MFCFLVQGTQILFLFNFLVINVSLAVFNLIPIPPLDGSKILGAVLRDIILTTLQVVA